MSYHMADRINDKSEKVKQAFHLLLEARDALPAMSLVSAKIHRVDLTLADRIEDWLEPWEVSNPTEQTPVAKPET